MKRLQEAFIQRDLEKKLVFLVGPRQVGKTWLAKEIAKADPDAHVVYLNYDRLADREIIKKEAWLTKTSLLILDELHKMPDWKRYIKGVFDTRPAHLKLLVTGSARLGAFRQGGESLAGRFFLHRLLPFSAVELSDTPFAADLDRLIRRGGFPEPFLAQTDEEADRWRMHYMDGLIREDILDFETIHDLKAMRVILEALRFRVGSPISYTSLSEDASVSPNTVKKYIDILESLYIVFKVTPFSKNIARSLLKEPKIYFFDTGLVAGDAGAQFENLMAVSLLKHVYALSDYKGKPKTLHYLRTKDKLEVDFCIAEHYRPELMIEAKYSDDHLHKPLLVFHEKLDIAAQQVVFDLKRERREKNLEVVSAETFLKGLWL